MSEGTDPSHREGCVRKELKYFRDTSTQLRRHYLPCLLFHCCFHSSYVVASFAVLLYLESDDLYSTWNVTGKLSRW